MKITRRVLQFAFLALTIIGVFVVRGDAERWCPFGGVEALYSYVTDGNFTCSLGVSNFYILGAVLLVTLLFRRAFCSYTCPIGTISEWLSVAGRRVGLRPFTLPYRVDRALSMLKYPALVVIVYITWRAGELLFRGFDPCYVLISRHGKDITMWAYIVSGGIVVGSLLLVLPFCRYLCPLAAVFTPFSWLGLTRVTRHTDACTDCGVCTQVCPMNIRVDRIKTVTAPRCTSCLDCVAECPAQADGALTWGPPGKSAKTWPQIALVGVLLACITGAVAATYAFPLPSFVHEQGERPATVATLSLDVAGVTCRGTSSALVETWLNRDDEYAVEGYLKVEIWSAADLATVQVTYDAQQTPPDAIRRAIVTPYIDLLEGTVVRPQFELPGYTPSLDDL